MCRFVIICDCDRRMHKRGIHTFAPQGKHAAKPIPMDFLSVMFFFVWVDIRFVSGLSGLS